MAYKCLQTISKTTTVMIPNRIPTTPSPTAGARLLGPNLTFILACVHTQSAVPKPIFLPRLVTVEVQNGDSKYNVPESFLSTIFLAVFCPRTLAHRGTQKISIIISVPLRSDDCNLSLARGGRQRPRSEVETLQCAAV